jgi:hypothetical protein
MSDTLVRFWLISVMCGSTVAMVACLMLSHSKYWQTLDKIFRIGVVLLTLGLGVQTFRSIFFLQFGAYPLDHYFPTWLVKDIGFCLMVYSLTVASLERK